MYGHVHVLTEVCRVSQYLQFNTDHICFWICQVIIELLELGIVFLGVHCATSLVDGRILPQWFQWFWIFFPAKYFLGRFCYPVENTSLRLSLVVTPDIPHVVGRLVVYLEVLHI